MKSKLITEIKLDGQYSIKLFQTKKGNKEGLNQRFSVGYGAHFTQGLDYTQACDELGACIMHQNSCDGKMD